MGDRRPQRCRTPPEQIDVVFHHLQDGKFSGKSQGHRKTPSTYVPKSTFEISSSFGRVQKFRGKLGTARRNFYHILNFCFRIYEKTTDAKHL